MYGNSFLVRVRLWGYNRLNDERVVQGKSSLCKNIKGGIR